MKHYFIFFILVFLPAFSSAQVFFDKSKTYMVKTDAVIIPSLHFGYAMQRGEFIAKNNQWESVSFNELVPEIYLGCQLLADGWMVGIHYGFLQKSILLGGGVVLPVKLKTKK